MSEIDEVKVDKIEMMDFFIGLKQAPARWYPRGEEDRRTWNRSIKKIFTTVERTLDEGHHPGLRHEDIVAHLMMQVMAYREPEDLIALIKTARQYGNQAMKKICRNCTHGRDVSLIILNRPITGNDLEPRYTAEGIGSETSSKFVENINASECNEKCEECRVGRTIMVANTMQTLVWGFEEIDKLRGYAVKWKNRWFKTHNKLKRQRWLTKQKSTMVTGIIGAKIALEKQNRELREALSENVMTAPEGVHHVQFDEFADLEKNLDEEGVKKVHAAIEKLADGQTVISGSIKKVLSDEEFMSLVPEMSKEYPRLAEHMKPMFEEQYSEPNEDDLLDNIEPENMTQEQTKRAKELRDRANSE